MARRIRREGRAPEELAGEALTAAINAALADEVGPDDSDVAAAAAGRHFLLTHNEWILDEALRPADPGRP